MVHDYTHRYIAYKLPLLPKSKDKHAVEGVGFYYMDTDSPQWRLASAGMNDTQGNAVYHTLQQIYGAKSVSLSLLWLV